MASKRRGRRSNRRLPDAIRAQVLAHIRAEYSDFGPTLAAEKLAERHAIHVSVETLRNWMMEAGLWVPRAQRRRIHQPRHRRACLGELIQIDGCQHDWFEGRAPKCSLLVYVDDATSRIMQLLFVESESTFSYFDATQRYLESWGRPVAFYSDRHSIFRVNAAEAKKSNRITQFGRALTELNIDLVCANTPQAKGRVERAHKTLQDRLCKELRLRGISTMAEANQFATEFVAGYNARFAKAAQSLNDAHRPLRPSDNVDEIFTHQEERKLSKNLTFQYNRRLILIEQSPGTVWLPGQRVRVCRRSDGSLVIKFGDVTLSYRVLANSPEAPGRIVSNKRLDAALAHAHALQTRRDIVVVPPRRGRTAREQIRQRATTALGIHS